MKQFVIDQMKEYQHKQNMIKAVKYQHGMEDAWMVEYREYIEDNDGTSNNRVDKLFWSKESAEEYITQEHPEDNHNGLFCEYTEVIPVLLHEIDEDECSCFSISHDGKYYDYEELTNDSWIVINENGYLYGEYDTEMFFDTYEAVPNDSIAYIGYDRDLEELYLEINCVRVVIDETEVAVVERILEGFNVKYNEKLGQYLKDKSGFTQ